MEKNTSLTVVDPAQSRANLSNFLRLVGTQLGIFRADAKTVCENE